MKEFAQPSAPASSGSLWRRRLYWASASTALVFVLFLGMDAVWPLPTEQKAFARVVVARDGTPLRAFADSEGVWRYPVRSDQVSPYYLEALLQYEDRWFYRHPGINPVALGRALIQNITHGGIVSGGSTLTMQAARLLDPHDRTLAGKLRQMFRALQLEWHWSKDDILTFYLNQAPFGGTIEGVQAASFAYFGHDAKQLSRAQAALLAVLPQAPSFYRPDRHPARAQRARDKVLDRLVALDVWSAEEVLEAKREVVSALPLRRDLAAPLLARRLVMERPDRVIHTSIDLNLQSSLEQQVSSYARRIAPRTSAAVLVVDNASLEVRAYVGSADFLDAQRFGHVDMVQASRSPGSTLKPLLYGLALDEGLVHSHSLLIDAPMQFSGYAPENFSEGFSGPVSLADALQRSLNVPAVQVLEQFGPGRFQARLQHAGLNLQLPPHGTANLALILGGAGARLEELVGAYTALANGGQAGRVRHTPDQPIARRPLLSAGSAWIIRHLLNENPRPDRANVLFRPKRSLAWKTGTSYGFRDSWAIGVGPTFTIGVWVGRPDGTPLPGHFGAESAAPLLFQVADQLPGPPHWLDRMPMSVKPRTICWPLGTADLSPDVCMRPQQAWILNDNIPPTWPGSPSQPNPWPSNPLSVLVAADTGLRVALSCDLPSVTREIALWPQAVEPWLPDQMRRRERLPAPDPRCPQLTRLADTALEIGGIQEGSRLQRHAATKKLPTLELTANGAQGETLWFVNGQFTARTQPHQSYQLTPGQAQRYQLSITDAVGATANLGFWVDP